MQLTLATMDITATSISDLCDKIGVTTEAYMSALSVSSKGFNIILKHDPCDIYINPSNRYILCLWRGNTDLQYVIDEVATVMYVCNYMTKGEKVMGETLKRVPKECKDDDIITQMNKIKREFLGERVVGLPESVMRVLSMWFMQNSRKVVQVNTNMKAECVSLPKPTYKLCELDDDDDDDEDVFATSIIDRYAARPNIFANMSLAEFAVSYDPVAKSNYGNGGPDCDNDIWEPLGEHCDVADVTRRSTVNVRTYQKQQTIKLKDGLGYMRKRKKQTILRTRRYKEHAEPEKYYHAKLLLYYPWENEDVLICGHATYHESYLVKAYTILPNAKKFNDNCHIFYLEPSEIDDAATQSM